MNVGSYVILPLDNHGNFMAGLKNDDYGFAFATQDHEIKNDYLREYIKTLHMYFPQVKKWAVLEVKQQVTMTHKGTSTFVVNTGIDGDIIPTLEFKL